MTATELAYARSTIARHLAAESIQHGLEEEFGWDEFNELTDDDWYLVVAEAAFIAIGLRPTPDAVNAAVQFFVDKEGSPED